MVYFYVQSYLINFYKVRIMLDFWNICNSSEIYFQDCIKLYFLKLHIQSNNNGINYSLENTHCLTNVFRVNLSTFLLLFWCEKYYADPTRLYIHWNIWMEYVVIQSDPLQLYQDLFIQNQYKMKQVELFYPYIVYRYR